MNARASNERVITCAWSDMVCEIVYGCMPFPPWIGPGVLAALTAPIIRHMIQNAAIAQPMVLDDSMSFIRIFSILMIPFGVIMQMIQKKR
jgi:hypothetical protein